MGAAYPVTRLMSSLPLGVTSNPTIFLVVGIVLATVGLFACWLPARRAAALDPVKPFGTNEWTSSLNRPSISVLLSSQCLHRVYRGGATRGKITGECGGRCED